jgi:hypothetical protein
MTKDKCAVTRVARWFVFKQKIQMWVNFGGLALKDVGIFFDTWSILQSFVIFYGDLLYFFLFWNFIPRKIWQPWL